ncbi:MAG TPA: type I-C CRISPR-associated protein Cas8c/Csd1 [Thiobacillus sp.]|nr:type I-C CRISPR-associated protein Cas8c/Csd1 [Thiobacillus sp.]
MSWIQKLYETYEQTAQMHTEEKAQPWPVAHFSKRAHVEIVIDESGQLRRIKKLGATESATLIPVTEASLGRAGSKIAPHPLCEETSYCAIDFPEGNKKKQTAYFSNLEKWCQSDQAHQKPKAILAYLKRATLWADLLGEKMIPLVVEGARGKEKINDEKIFIRWRVEASDNRISGTWEDAELIESWAKHDEINNPKNGVCMVLGEKARIGNNHPKFIRHAGDGAKLISANDSSGFTFRGRFTDDTGQQACGVSYEVTQKAHNALRWLIQRQGHRYGDLKQPQVVVCWAVGGAPIPDPFGSSLTLLLAGGDATDSPAVIVDTDAGQAFAKRLNLAMKGYRARLGPTDDIVVMGLDSATPGRMAITFYRELTGSGFLARIERWHTDFAWYQNFGKDKHFVGAPAPHDIAEAAYGRRLDDKLKKATIERLLPCIVDGQAFPRDLLESTIRRTCNRVGLERWEWEKFLGIACGLYRGAFKNEGYEMALETDRRSRDYLYGRLLALAENIEGYALTTAESGRETTAARFMQRFADRPVSTWRTVELALSPYKSRLNASAKGKGFLIKRMRVIDEILCLFEPEDFLRDTKLSGEFLLGYHCQRQALNPPKAETTIDTPAE